MDKMKAYLKKHKKAYIGVFGLPNSGTTLLSSSIHCMDNAFCLCEPHLAYNNGGGHRYLMLDKIGLEIRSAGGRIFPRLKNGNFITDFKSINKKLAHYLRSSSKYDIGGVKECYWTDKTNPGQKSVFEYVFSQNCYDIILFIFREPKVMYLSQLKKGVVPADGFIDEYKSFYKYYEDLSFDNKFLINYEKLCTYGASYLGGVLKELVEFDGEISLHPTSFATGSWSLKNLEKNDMLNKAVNKPKALSDFPEDFVNSEKKSLKKIESDLKEYEFLWK